MSKSAPYFNAEDLAITESFISRFNINNSDGVNDLSNLPPQIMWNFGHNIGFNSKDGLSKLDLFIQANMAHDNGQETDISLETTIHFIFLISNFKKYTLIDKEETLIDPNLASAILAVAYSTARGILIEKTHNTLFRGAVLPVLSPTKLLKTGQRPKK